jgi:hypothetical protein
MQIHFIHQLPMPLRSQAGISLVFIAFLESTRTFVPTESVYAQALALQTASLATQRNPVLLSNDLADFLASCRLTLGKFRARLLDAIYSGEVRRHDE